MSQYNIVTIIVSSLPVIITSQDGVIRPGEVGMPSGKGRRSPFTCITRLIGTYIVWFVRQTALLLFTKELAVKRMQQH